MLFMCDFQCVFHVTAPFWEHRRKNWLRRISSIYDGNTPTTLISSPVRGDLQLPGPGSICDDWSLSEINNLHRYSAGNDASDSAMSESEWASYCDTPTGK